MVRAVNPSPGHRSTARILIVEDDARVAALIREHLQENGLAADVATSGEEALPLVLGEAYDLIILDIMLPRMSGFTFCSQLRARRVEIPILILSARGMTDDRVRGLDLGADDYLTKPFDLTELNARVRALLRRRNPSEFLTLHVGDLRLDPVSRTVTRGTRRVELTNKEFALLEYLMRNAGQPVTRSMIAEHVWELSWRGLTNVIDVYVSHLRAKLEEGGERRLIHAVRGVGYTIDVEEES